MKKGVLYTIGASIILIICFIAFVLPSSLSRAADQQEGLVFGKYNGKKIVYEYGSDFTDFLSQYAEMFRNQGIEINSSNQYQIYQYAFNSTVIKYSQDDALKNAGYEVPQDSINLKMKSYFSDADGKFSMKAYKQADSSFIENLTTSIKDSLYQGRYYDDNYGSSEKFANHSLFGLKESKNEIAFLNKFGKEKRAFQMVTFDTENYPNEEKEKFGRANSQKFTKYDMSIITVDSKDLADKIISRIEKEQITFEDAITEYSDKNYSDSEGKLSNNSFYQIENILNDKQDAAKITALAKDEISPAIQTLIGYSIFKKTGADTTPDFSNEETITDVGNYISIYETSIIEDYFTDIAKKFIAEVKASDLESVLANYENAKLDELTAFPLNYGSSNLYDTMDTNTITALANADKSEEFLSEAFTVKENEYSKPLVMGGDIVVLKCTSIEKITEEEEKDFSTSLINFDQSSSQAVVFQSPNLENNFISVYFDNFINTSY